MQFESESQDQKDVEILEPLHNRLLSEYKLTSYEGWFWRIQMTPYELDSVPIRLLLDPLRSNWDVLLGPVDSIIIQTDRFIPGSTTSDGKISFEWTRQRAPLYTLFVECGRDCSDYEKKFPLIAKCLTEFRQLDPPGSRRSIACRGVYRLLTPDRYVELGISKPWGIQSDRTDISADKALTQSHRTTEELIGAWKRFDSSVLDVTHAAKEISKLTEKECKSLNSSHD